MQEIVVPVYNRDRRRGYDSNNSCWNGRLAVAIVVVVVAGLLLSLFQWRWLPFENYFPAHHKDTTTNACISTIVLLLVLLSTGMWGYQSGSGLSPSASASASASSPLLVISVFALGIQVSLQNPADTKSKRQQVIEFILRQDILDCIVVEQILAHRTRNCLLLRLVQQQQHKQRTTSIELLPNINYLSYTECIQIRQKIIKALQGKTLRGGG